MHRPHAFYRSHTVRWSFIVSGAFLTWALSPWAPPQWHTAPSLEWLTHLLPLTVGSVAFAAYTLLHLSGDVRAAVVADFLGLALYLCEFAALMVTSHDHPVNGFFFVSLFLACVLHFAAGRLALIERESG